jgi:hypothetical protein
VLEFTEQPVLVIPHTEVGSGTKDRPRPGPLALVALTVVRDPRGAGFRIVEGGTMGTSIRTIVRRTLESPAGGLVTTALAWAVVWPWLSHRRRHTPAAT